MPYEIFLPEFFKKIVKDLKKKFPGVKDDLKTAVRVILGNPGLGKSLRGFSNVKKLRVQNSDAAKGKRGGYRLIYLVEKEEQKIVPLLLYSKSQKEDVTAKELKALLAELDDELSELN